MWKFSVKSKEDDRDENPAKQEMWKGLEAVADAAKTGKLRRAKVAYGRDSAGQIIKAVVVFDAKKYLAAQKYIHGDGCNAEELHSVGDVNKLLENIKELIGKAQKESEEKNMLIGVDLKKQKAVEIKEAEVVAISPETEVAGAQSEPAPVNKEEVATEEVVIGDAKTDVEESESEVINDSDNYSVIDAVLEEVGIKDKEQDATTTAVKSLDEIKGTIMGDFKVTVPNVISKDKPADMFECNEELRKYVNQKMGADVSLKIWSSLNSHGEIFIHLRYKGVGATETVLKQIRRESTLGNKTCLNFLKNYKKMDITIIKALYKVLDELHDKLDEVDNAEAEGLTLYETYSAVINHVEARLLKVSEEENDNLDIKTHLIEGEQYVCIKGARKLERVLSDVGSPFKKMEFLKQLKYAEDVDKPLLKVADGRAYDNRETGDTDHWYYIRRDKNIMGEA